MLVSLNPYARLSSFPQRVHFAGRKENRVADNASAQSAADSNMLWRSALESGRPAPDYLVPIEPAMDDEPGIFFDPVRLHYGIGTLSSGIVTMASAIGGFFFPPLWAGLAFAAPTAFCSHKLHQHDEQQLAEARAKFSPEEIEALLAKAPGRVSNRHSWGQLVSAILQKVETATATEPAPEDTRRRRQRHSSVKERLDEWNRFSPEKQAFLLDIARRDATLKPAWEALEEAVIRAEARA